MVVPVHTFVFADIVGFTSLTALHGDDRAADLAVEFGDRVEALALRHGAEPVKRIGDAVMLRAVDAGRAMELGLAIVEELAGLVSHPPVRVGIHTGSAVARGRDWYGAAVNLAARLCDVAGPWEVLVSAATREAAYDFAGGRVRARRPRRLKNVVEPPRLYLVGGQPSAPPKRPAIAVAGAAAG